MTEGLPTFLRHLIDITLVCFTNRLTNLQGVVGMQRGLGITQECNVGNVFFALWLKKATGKNRETAALIVTENNSFKG